MRPARRRSPEPPHRPGYLSRLPAHYRQADGTLGLEGGGEVIDWVVVMRRFDEDLLFDRMAERGALTADHITELADEIAEFHGAAEQRPDSGGADAIRWIVDDDIAELAAMPETFGEMAVER